MPSRNRIFLALAGLSAACSKISPSGPSLEQPLPQHLSSAQSAGPCATPDRFDGYIGPLDLFTGCGVFPNPIGELLFSTRMGEFTIELDYLDHQAQSGPVRGQLSGPYPYVSGTGWSLGSLDESVENVSGVGWVRHTVYGDTVFATFAPAMGGFIASPPEGSVLSVAGPIVAIRKDESQKLYGGSPNNFIGPRGLLFEVDEYGGPSDNPNVINSATITRNSFAQATRVLTSRGESATFTYSPSDGYELQRIEFSSAIGGGYGDPWLFTVDPVTFRFQSESVPGKDPGTSLPMGFGYDANGLMTSMSQPNGEVTTFGRVAGPASSDFGKVNRIDEGVAGAPAAIGTTKVAYLPCAPGQFITEVSFPFQDSEEFRFDANQRRLINIKDADGRNTSMQWVPTALGTMLARISDPDTGRGLQYDFNLGGGGNPGNGSIRRVTSLPDQTVLVDISLFEGQNGPNDPPTGFYPTAWVDRTSGRPYTARYDGINRLVELTDDVNTNRVEITASTVIGGATDLSGRINGVAQARVTLDTRGDEVASFLGTSIQESSVERASDGVPMKAFDHLRDEVDFSNFTNIRLPQTITAKFAGTTVSNVTAGWNRWNLPTAAQDGVSNAAYSYLSSGEQTTATLATGPKTLQSESTWDSATRLRAIDRRVEGNLLPVQSWTNPPGTGTQDSEGVCR